HHHDLHPLPTRRSSDLYTVTWKPLAEAKLAEIWLASPDRTVIADVANQLDRELRIDPLAIGESRHGDDRTVLLPPLAFTFTVNQDRKSTRLNSSHVSIS